MFSTARKSAVATFFLALVGSPAQAADEAKDLINLCRQFADLPKVEFSTELIRLKSSCGGVLNAHILVSRPDSGYCRPRKIDMDELVKIYLAWADRNPDRWKDPRAVTVDAAFSEVFPCPKATP